MNNQWTATLDGKGWYVSRTNGGQTEFVRSAQNPGKSRRFKDKAAAQASADRLNGQCRCDYWSQCAPCIDAETQRSSHANGSDETEPPVAA